MKLKRISFNEFYQAGVLTLKFPTKLPRVCFHESLRPAHSCSFGTELWSLWCLPLLEFSSVGTVLKFPYKTSCLWLFRLWNLFVFTSYCIVALCLPFLQVYLKIMYLSWKYLEWWKLDVKFFLLRCVFQVFQ